MLKITNYKDLKKISKKKNIKNNKKISKIIKYIKKYGDDGIVKITNKYEKKKLKKKNIILNLKKIKKFKINKNEKKTIKKCREKIIKFHKEQFKKNKNKNWFIKNDKNILGQKIEIIKKIGMYIPGGKKIYPSSILMNFIPAKIAGVKKIHIASPVKLEKKNKIFFYTAKLMGIKKIYNIGGAQAIAALALGTKRIKRVNKIIGPGNKYVTKAKKEIYGKTGIDMLAGPTEIGILANKKTKIKKIIKELFAQIEHDKNCIAFLIDKNKKHLKKVIKSIKNKIKSKKKEIKVIKKSINNTLFIFEKNTKKCVNIINYLAPEHLSILNEDIKIIKKIKNTGSIFMGKDNSETIGDYALGSNHILPTQKGSKFSSTLNINDFIKIQNVSVIEENRKIKNLAKKMAVIEKLYFHSKNI